MQNNIEFQIKTIKAALVEVEKVNLLTDVMEHEEGSTPLFFFNFGDGLFCDVVARLAFQDDSWILETFIGDFETPVLLAQLDLKNAFARFPSDGFNDFKFCSSVVKMMIITTQRDTMTQLRDKFDAFWKGNFNMAVVNGENVVDIKTRKIIH